MVILHMYGNNADVIFLHKTTKNLIKRSGFFNQPTKKLTFLFPSY